ncbi:MAG: ABC transporter permease [Acidimicrobiales bacterium]
MTDTANGAAMSPVAHAASNAAVNVGPCTKAVRLPGVGKLLVGQIRYQVRLLISSGRAIAVGVGLPVILLVASKGKDTRPDVAGYAVFGLTITAWSTYGVRLVAAREDGVLKRWRATPLPRWCYFLGRILATALVGVMAGAVTVAAAVLFYGSHFGDGPGTQLTVTAAFAIVAVLFLGAFAWAATATALTSVIPTVEAAFPTLIFIYFPVIIISGVLLTNLSEPHWLSAFATYLPAQPLIDAVTHAVRHPAGAAFLPVRDVIVLACWAIGGLLAAIFLFRWEPHRPTQRRAARIQQ